MAIGRITGQMLSSQLNRNTTDLKFSTDGETNLLVLDASNDRIGIGTASPTVQFETTGSAIIGTDLTVTGNLTVNGSTTTINTTNLTVDDKNIELAHSLSGQAPTDAAADGGGIILKGDTDHTILWSNSNNSWDFSENVSVATGSAFQINNSNVLDANNLTLENIQIAGNVITSASNADISLQPSGTGKVVIEGIQIDGTVITGTDSTVISFGGNTLSGVATPSGASDVATKGYVDSQVGSANTLTLGDDASNSGSVNLNSGENLKFASGNSMTLTVSGNTITSTLNDNISVNQIGAKDSSAVSVTSPLQLSSTLQVAGTSQLGPLTFTGSEISSNDSTQITFKENIRATGTIFSPTFTAGTLSITDGQITDTDGTISFNNINLDGINQATITEVITNIIQSSDSTSVRVNDGLQVDGPADVGGFFSILNSTQVNAILDQDDMASNSATALATQQSIKAYVDSVAGGTITLGDSASNAGSVDINGNQDLEFRAGNSITPTVSGNGVTIALDSNITVNSITSADSSFVKINDSLETEAAQINQTLTVDGDAQIKGNLTVQGTTTYIETTNTKVSDPLLLLNNGNSGGADIDSGIMVERGSAGNNAVFYWNEGDDKFKAVLTTSDESATTITDTATATIVANLEGNSVTVNQIGANDSSAIDITSPVYITGALNTDTSLQIAGSTVIDGILDEDNFASNSATKLATQQSIKAYVDAVAGGTITLGDSASNAGSVDINAGQDLEFRSGDSLTLTVAGNGVTASLNDNITVNQIGAKDSSAVSITSPLQVDGTLQVSGTSSLVGTVTVANDITISSGTITSDTGTIDFNDENITTFGNITANGSTVFANTVDTNIITSTDSTAVSVQDNLHVDGNLDVGSSFTISNGTSITAILDEDNMASNSDTALATQQSIKAYVDSVAGGTITLGDSASNSGSVDINAGQDLEFRSGDSITPTVSGNGVTIALNDNITVNQIGAKDSTAISLTSNTQVDGTLQVSGTSALVGNVTMSGTFTSASGSSIGNLTLADGSITDSSGTISFGDENLTTTGNITGAAGTFSGNVQVGGNLTVSGTTTSVNTTNLEVQDPLIELSKNNSGGADVDAGILVNRGSAGNNAALYWNEGDDKFKAVLTASTATSTSVLDTSIATIVANIESPGTSSFANITVNQIGANDSSAVSITSPLQTTSIQSSGNVDINGSATIGTIQISGNTITSTDSTQINFGGEQLTDVADPTQPSDVATKSYVDSQTSSIVTTIGISDSASNSSTLTLGVNDLEFRSGDSITTAVAGTGVTFNLNDNITVNQIGAKDSTAVSITSNTQVDGTLQVSGASTLVGNVSSSGSITAGTSFIIGGADLNETDLEKLDGITDGTGAANKALVLDASQDITSGVNVFTATTGDFQTVKVNTIESDDSTAVTVNDGLQVNGNFGFNEGVTVTQILDEDNFASNSATALATQQSIKAYVDAVAQGLHVHASVHAITNTPLATITGDTVTYNNGSSGVGATLTLDTALDLGGGDIDGDTDLQVGDRIIVNGESTAAHNGIYVITTTSLLTRATDFDTPAEMAGGDFVFVTHGTLYADTGWVLGEPVTTVGSDAVDFIQFSGAGAFTAGDGLTLTGTEFSVNVDSSTIEINADTLRVKDAGITNAKLAKSTITLVGDDSTGTAVSLGESFKIAGGESLNASVTADTLTVNLDDNITVNQIGAKDSTAINITSPVYVTGALNTDTSLVIAGSTVIDGILDEDNFASDSATALATQQSIKAYVDTQISASTVAELNDIGDVDAVSGNKLDGDILVVNDDSSNVFTLSSQLTTGLRVPSGTTAQRPTIYAGIVRYNSETGKYEGSTDGSSWNAFAMEGSVETLNKDVFTGDASSLTFTFVNVADPIANSGNGELGLIVYIDNVLQEPTQNYTVTPTAITFDSAPHQAARIVVIQGFDGGAGGGTAGGLTTVTNTDVDSAVENLDTFNASSYRAAHYQYVIENDDTAEYQTGQLSIIHDGSTAQVQEYAMLKTGSNDLITFSVDIDSGNVRLRGSAQAPNSKFRAKRILLEVQ